VIVLGDLNDEPLAATTPNLLGPPGSEINTRGFDLDDHGEAQRLWNLAPRTLPEDRRFSRVFNGRPELIDHILVTHALVHDVDSVTTGTADLPSVTKRPGRAARCDRVRPCPGDRAIRQRLGVAAVAVSVAGGRDCSRSCDPIARSLGAGWRAMIARGSA
jgi:hypothetical protein